MWHDTVLVLVCLHRLSDESCITSHSPLQTLEIENLYVVKCFVVVTNSSKYDHVVLDDIGRMTVSGGRRYACNLEFFPRKGVTTCIQVDLPDII